jgi:uncharacterized phage-like protein YoqJ
MLTLEALNMCIERGYHTFISGGAQGFDLLAAECVIEKRAQFPQVRLVIARPFPGQHSNKPPQSLDYIHGIESRANWVIDVSPDPYSAAKMQIRNKWMVDNAKIGIALWSGKPKGGTYNCLQYAKGQGKWVLVIDSGKCKYWVEHVKATQ